ncbi:sensor histidine kinase [Nonomuraea sp. NPDC048826]|uniref:sensor histidine kinase n=1 Tax=Nonomuraea sp. NPDC048826 TaxID=3364347 RepID=UPI00371998F0
MRFAAEGGRVLGAVVLGALTALVELVFLLVSLPFLGRGRVAGAARRLAALEVRRLRLEATELDGLDASDGGPAVRYLAARVPAGLLGGLVVLLLVFGIGTGVRLVAAWAAGETFDGMTPTAPLVAYIGVAGLVLLFLVLSGIGGVHGVERRLARRVLTRDRAEVLERRIAELSESRAGIVAAVDAERRRIERDLHDGLQQRLVALSMLIGRARRGHPDLMGQAHVEAQQALAELREVAWRVYPSGLDALGLGEALAGVAERSAVPVTVTCELAERPPAAVEAAAYFVVSEAVTNANKHAGAARVEVGVHREGATLVVRVCDDGTGGASASGGGLSGLRRRVAALDGVFAVDSPPGGPTVIGAELPCG